MHRRFSYTSFFLLFYTFSSTAQSLDLELARLKTNLVLLAHSEEVEERTLWSPRSDYLACRIDGKWLKVPLRQVELKAGKWQGKRVGIMELDTVSLAEVNEKEMQLFKAASGLQPIFIRTKAGVSYALKPNGDGVALIATANGKSRELWSSKEEGCYSLSLSPDEKYLACICEKGGLLVTKLEEEFVSN